MNKIKFWSWLFSIIAVFLIFFQYQDKQERFVEILGFDVNFKSQKQIRIGGINPQYDPAVEYTASAEDRFILPTKYLPVDFGVFQLNNNTISLLLKEVAEQKDSEAASNFLELTYPSVSKKDGEGMPFKKNEIIPWETLKHGIEIRFPKGVAGKKAVLKVESLSNNTFRIFYTPSPQHLSFKLPGYAASKAMAMEFKCDGFTPSSLDDKVRESHLVRLHIQKKDHFNLLFNEKGVFQDGQNIAKVGQIFTVHGSDLVLKFNEKLSLHWYIIVFYMICIFYVYKVHLHFSNKKRKAKDIFTIYYAMAQPIFTIAIIFNIGCILALHFFFRNAYQMAGREPFILSGSLCIIAALMFVKGLSTEKKGLVFLSKQVNKFFTSKQGGWLLFGIMVLLGVAVTLGEHERLGIFPMHVIGRLCILIGLVAIGSLQKTNKWYSILFIGSFLLGYMFVFDDKGFLMYMAMILFFFPLLTSESSKTPILAIFFGIVLIGIAHWIDLLPHWNQLERIFLAYHDAPDFIKTEHQATTEAHKIYLQAMFSNIGDFPEIKPLGLLGHSTDLNLPLSFQNVIFSDYVLLFGGLYMGGWLFFSIITVLFIGLATEMISLFSLIRYSGKNIWQQKPIIAMAVVVLSYVTQIFYMYGCMLRVFPLTGQSIPFLSLSITEPILMIFFLMLFYLFIYHKYRHDVQQGCAIYTQTYNKDMNRYRLFTSVAFGLVLFIGVFRLFHMNIRTNITYDNEKMSQLNDKQINIPRSKSFKQALNSLNLNDIRTKLAIPIAPNWLQKRLSSVATFASFFNNEHKKWELWNTFKSIVVKHYMSDNINHIIQDNNFVFEREERHKLMPEHLISALEGKPFKFDAVLNLASSVKDSPKFDLRFKDGTYYFQGLSVPAGSLPQQGNNIQFDDPNMPADATLLLSQDKSEVYQRYVNNELIAYFKDLKPYGCLPDLNSTVYKKNNLVTLDMALQAISYAALGSYCRSNGAVLGGGIVVLEHKTGNVKAMASYLPDEQRNDLFLPQNYATQELQRCKQYLKNQSKGGVNLYSEVPNLTLSGFSPASTWKFIQAAGVLSADTTEAIKSYPCTGGENRTGTVMDSVHCPHSHGNCNFDKFISHSCNHYSIAQIKSILNDSERKKQFLDALKEDFGIVQAGERFVPEKGSIKQFFAPTIGKIEGLTPAGIARNSVGGNNVKVPLLWLTTDMARIVTGNQISPYLYRHAEQETKRVLKPIHGNMKALKAALQQTGQHGTANFLSKQLIGVTTYSKTGTSSPQDHTKYTYLVFSTQKYSFGIMMLYNADTMQDYKEDGNDPHAKWFVDRDYIPYVKTILPNYLN